MGFDRIGHRELRLFDGGDGIINCEARIPFQIFRALLGANTNVPTVGRVACTVVLLSAICSGTDHRLGPTAGAGIEYGITSAISAKFEHLYIAAVSLVVSRINEV